jgi:hypothetical protein
LSSLDNLLDLIFNFFIAFLELIELCIEHINVILKTVVLLFSFDESCNDFLNVGDSGGLLDLVESILNDFNVSQVLVHELSLFFVGLDNLIQSSLSNDNRV